MEPLSLLASRLAGCRRPCGDEFIAAPASNRLAPVGGDTEPLADEAKPAVSGFHAARSIDGAQAIEIQYHDCPGVRRGGWTAEFGGEASFPVVAGTEAG